MRFRTLISLLSGRRYHWRVEIEYRSPGGQLIASRTLTLTAFHPQAIDCHRPAKKTVAPPFVREIPRRLLCNGRVVFEPRCYLGWW